MASLEKVYGRYIDRQRDPISIPSNITRRYESLLSVQGATAEGSARFINEMQQNIANFDKAQAISFESNEIYDWYKTQLLLLGLKADTSANMKAIDRTYVDIVESEHFTGADILDFEQRYQVALNNHTDDAIAVFEPLRALQEIAYKIALYSRELTDDEKAALAAEINQFSIVFDEVEALATQQKWTKVSHKIPPGTSLGSQLTTKMQATLDNRENIRADQIVRYRALDTELSGLKEEIEQLDDKLEGYEEELREPCQSVRVDYSCASRCPDKRVRDIVLGYYKNVPDYKCLSHCDRAERQKQASYDEDEAYCTEEKEDLKARYLRYGDDRNRLVDKFNGRLQEFRGLHETLNEGL
ncbi:hypothetical protein [Amphritea sp.]|uniref:hypothetical protein n=1 Tax=Amphritea sp. TaxID=1872502 RepID=UPI003A914B45